MRTRRPIFFMLTAVLVGSSVSALAASTERVTVGQRGVQGNDGANVDVAAHSTQSGAETGIDVGAAAGGVASTNILTLTGFDKGLLNTADFVLG